MMVLLLKKFIKKEQKHLNALIGSMLDEEAINMKVFSLNNMFIFIIILFPGLVFRSYTVIELELS